eukprot:gene15085-17832_t
MVIGEAHLHRGSGDASKSTGELITFLDDIIAILEGAVDRMNGSYEYFTYYSSNCEKEVQNVGNYSDFDSLKSDTSSKMLQVYSIAIYELEELVDIAIFARDSLKDGQAYYDSSKDASFLIIVVCALANVTLLIQSGPTLLVLCHLDKQAEPYYRYMRERTDKCFAAVQRKLSLMTCRQDTEVEKAEEGEVEKAEEGEVEKAEDGEGGGLVAALWIMLLWSLGIMCLRYSIAGSDYCHDVDGNTAKFATKYLVDNHFEDKFETEEQRAEMEVVLYDVLMFYTTCPAMEDATTDADPAGDSGLDDVFGAEGYTLLTTQLNISSVMKFNYPKMNTEITQLLPRFDTSVYDDVCEANTMNMGMLEMASALGRTDWPRSWNWAAATCSDHFGVLPQQDTPPFPAQPTASFNPVPPPPGGRRLAQADPRDWSTGLAGGAASARLEEPPLEMMAMSFWTMLYCNAGGEVGAFNTSLLGAFNTSLPGAFNTSMLGGLNISLLLGSFNTSLLLGAFNTSLLGGSNTSLLGALNTSLQTMMAIGDTDNVQSISTTLQELQEVEAACCQGTYAELQELLYVIPVACETMDLLECYVSRASSCP